MITTQYIFIIAGIIVVGCIRLWIQYFSLKTQLEFAKEYLQNYRKLIQQYQQNHFETEIYNWLMLRSARIQIQLGIFGLANHIPPLGNSAIQNYQLIVNTLPQIRTDRVYKESVSAVEDGLVRYIGWQEDSINVYFWRNLNPLAWLKEGIQFIFLLPIRILEWSGLTNEGSTEKISSKSFVRIIVGITTIVSIFGTIMGIVVDLPEFVKIAVSYMH